MCNLIVSQGLGALDSLTKSKRMEGVTVLSLFEVVIARWGRRSADSADSKRNTGIRY